MSKLYKIITDIKKLEDELEKSWKKAQIGEIRTHKDGRKYKKIADTGNTNKDWQLVTQPKDKKDRSDESSKQGRNDTSEGKEKLSNKELKEAAKNASETALNNAIKQSGDALVREAAHQELKRREEEEKPQEEIKEEDKKKLTIKDKVEELSDKYKDLIKEAMNDDFSNLDKTNEYIKKQKEYSRYISRVNEFNEVDKDEHIKKCQELLDLKSEEEVKDFFGDGDIIGILVEGKVVSVLTEDVYCQRVFDKNGTVYMSEIILNPDIDKGQGKGSDIFFNQVNSFKKKGFKSLITDAAKSDTYNGYYTWARLGYGFRINKSRRYLEQENFINIISKSDKLEIKQAQSVSELMSFKAGRDFWRENGIAFRGSFDLSDDSESMFILNKYMEEKKNARK